MLSAFREVVVADFEFAITPGNRPQPVCVVARELKSGRRFRVWQDEFGPEPPYATGPDVLFVAYYASAELGCYKALDWQMPSWILDLCIEFRNKTNGIRLPDGASLLGALAYHGLDGIGATEKRELQVAIGSGTWADHFTKDEILDYCESDVDALERLLPAMLPRIDLPRALVGGDTWPPPPRWSGPACRSISRSWRYCGSTGPIFRMSSSRRSTRITASTRGAASGPSASSAV
jgi:hypothetical protein